MPSEHRVIFFTSEEAIDAIARFSKMLDTPLFRGTPTELHVRKNPHVRAILEVQKRGREEIDTIDLNSSHLAAALINFCRETRIPLPSNAKKELDVSGEQLVLRLEVGEPSEAMVDAVGVAS